MTDIALLKQKIKDSKMTMVGIAEVAGMVRETLYNRLDGKGEFTVSEADGLTKALHLSKTDREKIFFSKG